MILAVRLAALWREALVAEFHPPLGRGDAESYNNAVAWLGEAAEAAEAGDLGLALHRMSKADAAFDGLEPDGFGDALLKLELAAYEAAAREARVRAEPEENPVSNALVKQAPSDVATHTAAFTADQVALIKRTICQGSTDDELALFVTTAKRLGLDPFARQIFAVKRWDSKTRGDVMAIQVSIDGFRLVAERTERYAPGRPTELEMDEVTGLPVKATAFVKKLVAGEWHEVGEDAFYEEYVQTNKEGAPNAMWKRMPRVMLAKCAESRALRRAFPAELSGIYSAEEMGQGESKPIEPEVVLDPDELLARIDRATALADLGGDLLIQIKKLDEADRALLRPRFEAKRKSFLDKVGKPAEQSDAGA